MNVMLLLLFVTIFTDFGHNLVYMVIKETHMRLIQPFSQEKHVRSWKLQ